jgi:hypothetical protein
MKNGRSCMPLSCALKPLIFELSDSADANGDNDVDIADAVHIVNYVVGKISALSRSAYSDR